MADTIYESFLETASRQRGKTALLYKAHGRYVPMTYGNLRDSVEAVATGIQRLGIRKGDTVGIFSFNRPEWAIADLAILKVGGVVVPIYHSLPPAQVRYIIEDSKIKLLFAENGRLLSSIVDIIKETHGLKTAVVFDGSGVEPEKWLLKFDGLKQRQPSAAEESAVVHGSDIATIVYTSGTTGEPKGVILTHDNILSNVRSGIARFRITSRDIIVSYLPLCHMFERTCGFYTVLMAGGTIAYAESVSTVAEDVARTRPTVLLAVPRVIEKVYHQVTEKVEKGWAVWYALVSSAMRSLNEYANLRYKKERIPLLLRVKYFLSNRLVASRFRKIGGGRLRLIVSGGAPIDRQIEKIFYILGFNIVEGYGLTETSPAVCSNTVADNILGTVGKPIDGVKVKISETGEILVKGPNVMKGYLNKPHETAMAIDEDGWFHTGDLGRFDESGNLIITGRLKEIIVTSYGKKVAPFPIEAKICRSPYIEQAMLCGDRRPCLVALVVPHRESIERYASEKGISFEDYPALLQTAEIKQLISGEIESAMEGLASYERVKAFALLPEGLTLENEMLTPTLKLRRAKVAKRYAATTGALYEEIARRTGQT